MPIYAFRCEACGHAFDRLQKLSEEGGIRRRQARNPGAQARREQHIQHCGFSFARVAAG